MKPFCKFISWLLSICFNKLVSIHTLLLYIWGWHIGLIVVLTVSSHSSFPRAFWVPLIMFYKHTHPNHKLKLQDSCTPAKAAPLQKFCATFGGCSYWQNVSVFSRATRQDLICSWATTEAHHTEKAVIYYLHILLWGYIACFCTKYTHPIYDISNKGSKCWYCTYLSTSEPCDILSRAFKLAMYAVHDLPCMETRKGSIFLTSPSLFLTSQPSQLNIYRKQ